MTATTNLAPPVAASVATFVERRHASQPFGLDRSRSSGLDALRAFAALFVVAFHLKTVSGVGFGPLDPFIGGGDSGVYVFFALSGYLLYKPFVRGEVDLPGYALKRAGRILPGYFVALIGLTLLTRNQLPLEHPIPFITMSASYDIALRGFLGNAWTLSAEILFYVTLPFIARLAKGRELQVLTALGFASFSAGLVYWLTLTDSTLWLVGTYPFVFFAFVPGMLLAVAELHRPAAFSRLAWSIAPVAGTALVVIGAVAKTPASPVATGAGTALLMGWLLQHPLPGARPLAFAGGASYALYLWHKDAFIAFGPWAGLGLTVIAAGISWALIERPVLAQTHALASRWRQGRRARRAAAVSAP